MEINKILFTLILFIFLAIAGISGFVFAYSKEIETINQTQEQVLKPALQPVFDPAALNWEQTSSVIPWQARDSQAVVVFKNKMWLMGGLDANGLVLKPGLVQYEKALHFSDVWSSDDGINWQMVAKTSPWGDRRSIQVVEFKNKMWLMGGWGPVVKCQNDTWSSEDGINWTKETEHAAWPAREGHQLVVFQNKMWLIGGVRYDTHQLFNDVWYSEDGINWMEANVNANFSPRWDHAVAVFDNKLWLTGGMQFGEKILNDVWYSENGKDWILVIAPAPFTARQGHGLVSYKNKLWIISRLDVPAVGGENDIWYSDNGFNWQKTNNNPMWAGREDTSIAVFKDKIWVLGGMDKNWQWKNDVWFSIY
ncbi:MAG: hypothetical protein AAB925_00530 [Patescibacteria group bacterium]